MPPTRNPTWTRDELIVLLDFYLRQRPKIPGKTSAEISELSDLLNRLQTKLGGEIGDKFRNNNGVYMKLMNFRRFDPQYPGVGLERGGKDEEVVWNLYADHPSELGKAASAIRAFVDSPDQLPPPQPADADDSDTEEGKILSRVHRYRERDLKIVELKKKDAERNSGHLRCEVCGFEFVERYGKHGDGFTVNHSFKCFPPNMM